MKIENIGKLSAIFFITAFVVMLIASARGWTHIDLDISNPFEKIVTMLSSLFIVSVLLERSLDVIIGITKGDSYVSQRSAYRNALTVAKASAEVVGASDRQYVHNLQKTRLELDKSNNQKKRLKLCAGYLVAVLLSAAGFQVLSNFVTNIPSSFQGHLFVFLDIFLTAGLVAGGSQGIAEVIDIFRLRQDHNRADLNVNKIVAQNNRLMSGRNLQVSGVIPDRGQVGVASSNSDNELNLTGSRGVPVGTADLTWLSGSNLQPLGNIVVDNIELNEEQRDQLDID